MKRLAFPLALLLAVSASGQRAIDYKCSAEDIDAFGLNCSESEPCQVLVELSSIESVGARLFVSGNLHTGSVTMFGLLLMTEDGGKTWQEPAGRIRQSTLEQIQFVGFGNGWVAGGHVDPLPRDPFVLITTDGGKNWRNQAMFEDTHAGTISKFWFESVAAGELVLDARKGYELYQSSTGGESWELKATSNKAPTLAKAKPPSDVWRIRADAATKSYKIEQRTAAGWDPVSSIPFLVAECK